MVKLILHDIPPEEIMRIVRELRDQGLYLGQEFDFSYVPTQFDPISGHHMNDRHTVFTFYVDKYATFFALKYASK